MVNFGDRFWELHQKGGLDGKCIIRAESEEFTVSKLVLAFQSRVFEEKMQENEVLELEESKEVVQQIIEFLHRGSVTSIELCPKELYIASIKYEIKKLQDLVSKTLAATITHGNFLDRLLLAFVNEDQTYKNQIWEQVKRTYSSQYFRRLLTSEEWNLFFIGNQEVACAILTQSFDNLDFRY